MPRDRLEVPASMVSCGPPHGRPHRLPEAERMRSSFLQRLEAVSLSGLSGHRSLHDLVDSDSDAREASPGSGGPFQSIGLAKASRSALEQPKTKIHRSSLSRPEPLEVAEAPFPSDKAHQVQGSPSELSTATTVPGEEPNDLQGETVQRMTSPVGSSGLASDLGESGYGVLGSVWNRDDPVVTMARRLKGHEVSATKKLVSELEMPVKVLSNGRVDGRALHQASTQELEESLSLATSQARRLWRSVEESEQLVNELQAMQGMQATGSQHRCAGHWTAKASDLELKAAQDEERKLRERVAFLEHKRDNLGAETKRRSTRLKAKIARLEQERQEVAEEVSFSRGSCLQLQAEVQALRDRAKLREEEQKRDREMEAHLKLLLMSLLPKPVAKDADSLFDLATLVGRTWAEARNAGEARRVEMISLKEGRQKLERGILDTQAHVESETQRLLRAEEELSLLKSQRRAQERLVKEELAVARAENKLLNEERSLWNQTRPRLLNLIEDLKRPASAVHAVSSPEVEEALEAAKRESQELQEMMQQLEKDKAALIQEQEEMIRRVRERVAPLQNRILAQQS